MKKSSKILLIILASAIIITLIIIQIKNYDTNINNIKSPESKTGAVIVQGLEKDYEESKTTDTENNDTNNEKNTENENTFGAKYALQKDDFTIEEMLKYAIEDEFLARQEYESIMEEYGEQRPFSNIILAEETHIKMLKEVYENYDYTLPEDKAIEYIVIPDSIEEALKIGVKAEIDNIAMYNKFLENELPEDIEDVFIKLRDASEKHLQAFENGVDRGK